MADMRSKADIKIGYYFVKINIKNKTVQIEIDNLKCYKWI